jgi:hypothetical protein
LTISKMGMLLFVLQNGKHTPNDGDRHGSCRVYHIVTWHSSPRLWSLGKGRHQPISTSKIYTLQKETIHKAIIVICMYMCNMCVWMCIYIYIWNRICTIYIYTYTCVCV